MQLRRLSLALTGAAAMAVILVGVGLPGLPSSQSPPSPTGPSTLAVWDQHSYQGDLLGGLNHSIVMPVRALPNHDSMVYVDGSFSMLSWTYYTHGLFNESGVCANTFSPADACSVYVGIWTPAAWDAYVRGAPMAPVWCFPGNSPSCQNASAGDLGTPNLNQFDGTNWEIVVWNLATFQLSGSYQFTVYSSSPPS
ncbi:MAG: hypothetical protein L3J95_02620 [Thermoplasmata archaeon]|nr:hypothetical protein [Thermoplasmata archaeon]MCI4359301.1 hypothetical protein [Thermoplasmata archaeon]